MLIALGILLVAILALLGYASTRPEHFRYERSITVQATPDVAFGHIADFHAWEAWSPWAKLDPEMKTRYEGAASGVGAKYSWSSDKGNVGAGAMTITATSRNQSISIDLAFERPFKADNVTLFTFKPQGGGTTITWSMEGKNNLFSRVMGIFMNMDKLVGADFEKGLASLKHLCERDAALRAEAAPQR